MKTRLLNILMLCVFALFLFNCCDDCKKLATEQKTKTATEIQKGVAKQFEAFNEIKLPVFLGKKTDDVRQHLHIEGSIGNPFFIAGSFTSEIITTNVDCKIKSLNLEVIPTGATGASTINYKFTGTPSAVSDGKGGLKIKVEVIKDSSHPTSNPNSINVPITSPITVEYKKIIDMEVIYSGTKSAFVYENLPFCCEPVICKSIIYFD